MASVWDELRRRNVVRVAIAYAIVSWLILQLADVLIPLLSLPEWVGRLVFLILVIGFALALIFAWVFELTPEGIQRDSKVSHNKSVSQHTGRRLNFLIIGAFVIALGYTVISRGPVNPDEPPIDAAILNRPMVAVLPFVKTSGDSTFDHLTLGLMDEIIVSLQRLKAFPVVSRGAVLMFQSRDKSIVETAEELNAQYVVDGSIRADGDNLRVLVTMSDSKGNQVWARPFVLSSNLEGLFTVVDEVAASIAGAVRESEVDRAVVANRPPVAAWEHYIKGLSVILGWSPDRHEEGRGHIESALELDPNMAEAWWALGEFEVVEMMFFPAGEEESRIRLEKSVGYFQRANELSPFQGGACGCLGVMLAMLNRTSEAFTLLKEALHSNPLSTRLRVDYAQVLVSEGRFDEARAMAESATGMEPIGWDLAMTWTIRATADLAEGRDEEARANVHRAKYASARNVYSTPSAILILYVLGDREDAIELYQDFVSEIPEFSFDNPITMYYIKSIDPVIASRQRENSEFPPNARAIVDELASQMATPAN
jgi:TolB-like protein/tetratricopeptide (TPR) repeat protein